MDFKDKLEEWMKLDYILPEDIPNIDLYMDQITTFMDSELKNTKRFEGDKILTKTMINNYSKSKLLPPSMKKKYSQNHLILLIYIYYMKNFLSIADIKDLLQPLTDTFYTDEKDLSFSEIYEEIFALEQSQNHVIKDSVLKAFDTANTTFKDVKDKDEQKKLHLFSFITLLGYDIYSRKQLIERIIDELFIDDTEKEK
ncbi:MAG: DUF1836 domain-containing protein [Anaerostipes sp.]|nr:DUF1836 domain-containing protein [Anaerostipes sp.]